MSKQITYTQCVLSKPFPPPTRGIQLDTAWIPTTLAKKGKILKIKKNDKWDDGWKVEDVYETLPEDRVFGKERDYRTQHEASDAYRDKDGKWVTPQTPKG